jgi:hypothetical protein
VATYRYATYVPVAISVKHAASSKQAYASLLLQQKEVSQPSSSIVISDVTGEKYASNIQYKYGWVDGWMYVVVGKTLVRPQGPQILEIYYVLVTGHAAGFVVVGMHTSCLELKPFP